MELFLWCMVGLVGLCFGSMVTLVSYRLPRDLPIGATRSKCPSCRTPLTPRDLIPFFSWMFSKGKCRHCASKVSFRYPLTELVTATLFLLIYAKYGISLESLVLMLTASVIMILIVTDLEHYIIPDELQWVLLTLGAVYHLFVTHSSLLLPLGGLLVGLAIGWGLQKGYWLLKKRDGLGTGDVKFFAVAGIWLGFKMLVPFFFYAGLMGVASALVWRVLGKGKVFPFGPAIAITLLMLIVYPETAAVFWRLLSMPAH